MTRSAKKDAQDIFAVYRSRPDVAPECWDLCGVYTDQAEATAAVLRASDKYRLGVQFFAVDVLTLGEDLE